MANIRKLPLVLAQKAYELFNEDEDCIINSLNYIKAWLMEQPHLKVRMDDQWLIAFLRGNRYNLEAVKKQLETLYSLKSTLPEFKNRDPTVKPLKDLIGKGLYLPLENKTDPSGPLLMLFRAVYDPAEFSLNVLLKYDFIITDILLNENDNFNILGKIMICDLQNVTMAHIMTFTPSFAKKCCNAFFNAYCVNLVSTHFINAPRSFSLVYNILKLFLPRDVQKRLFIHKDVNELFDYVPQINLPKEYGGEGGTLEELTRKWQAKIESYREWLLEDEKFGRDHELISKTSKKHKSAMLNIVKTID